MNVYSLNNYPHTLLFTPSFQVAELLRWLGITAIVHFVRCCTEHLTSETIFTFHNNPMRKDYSCSMLQMKRSQKKCKQKTKGNPDDLRPPWDNRAPPGLTGWRLATSAQAIFPSPKTVFLGREVQGWGEDLLRTGMLKPGTSENRIFLHVDSKCILET